MSTRILIVVALLAGCQARIKTGPDTPTAQAEYRCIGGLLHSRWPSDVWVQEDGRKYIGRPDGPIKCTEVTP